MLTQATNAVYAEERANPIRIIPPALLTQVRVLKLIHFPAHELTKLNEENQERAPRKTPAAKLNSVHKPPATPTLV